MLEDLKSLRETYEIVIGLEVHAQLNTQSKLMSPASNQFGQSPNSAVSSVCIGLPGALPSLNRGAVKMALLVAKALHCEIHSLSVFSRKHYFYPDLPKGYQISQYDRPYATGGQVEFFLQEKKYTVPLTRIHMEEDAGKNLHFAENGHSLVDLNRSSVPLIEIVSEPALRSPEEAGAYLKALRSILRYLKVCDGNLEEGNFRCDANVSLRRHGEKEFGTRVELKNINSFRNLEKAISFEALRQRHLIEKGEKVLQETRLWDANENRSHGMRSKEEASDYRYMPEPDLLPLVLQEKDLEIDLPELPMETCERLMRDYGRSAYDAEVLSSSKSLAEYFEILAGRIGDASLASNFVQTNVLAMIEDVENDLEQFYPTAEDLAELLLKLKDNSLSLSMAKEVFEAMVQEKRGAEEIILERGLSQVNDEAQLLKIIQEVIDRSPQQLEQFRSGKDKLFGYFMGQCQKELKGKANPAKLKSLLEKSLKA